MGAKSGQLHSMITVMFCIVARKSSETAFSTVSRPEIAGDVIISGVIVGEVHLNVCVKLGDSWTSRSRVIRTAHFVMDNERQPTRPIVIDRNRPTILAFRLKSEIPQASGICLEHVRAYIGTLPLIGTCIGRLRGCSHIIMSSINFIVR